MPKLHAYFIFSKGREFIGSDLDLDRCLDLPGLFATAKCDLPPDRKLMLRLKLKQGLMSQIWLPTEQLCCINIKDDSF